MPLMRARLAVSLCYSAHNKARSPGDAYQTISEAAACQTPAIATRIAGHIDAIDHGVTGMLVDLDQDFGCELERVLSDPMLRRRLGLAAAKRAAPLTWEATALGNLSALAGEVRRRVGRIA